MPVTSSVNPWHQGPSVRLCVGEASLLHSHFFLHPHWILFPCLFAILCSCPSSNIGLEQAHHRIREGQATSKAFTDQILAAGTNGSVRQDHLPSSSRPAFYHPSEP